MIMCIFISIQKSTIFIQLAVVYINKLSRSNIPNVASSYYDLLGLSNKKKSTIKMQREQK